MAWFRDSRFWFAFCFGFRVSCSPLFAFIKTKNNRDSFASSNFSSTFSSQRKGDHKSNTSICRSFRKMDHKSNRRFIGRILPEAFATFFFANPTDKNQKSDYFSNSEFCSFSDLRFARFQIAEAPAPRTTRTV